MGFIQVRVTPLPADLDLTGKTVIVTGGSAGLGLESARQFLALKASKVILGVRSPSKGEMAREQLISDVYVQRRNPKADVKVMRVDMEDYKSVIEFADNVKKENPELDVLLLNAGIGELSFKMSVATGHEKCTQVNYLSNVLLTLELLPLLEAAALKKGVPSRLSWVGSRSHKYHSLTGKKRLNPSEGVLDYFDNKDNYSTFASYANTKLLAIMFLAELGKRVSKEQVIINSMCPGMVNTGMSDVLPIPLRWIMNGVKFMRARTVEQGAWILVNAAVAAGPESHGRFLLDKEVMFGPPKYATLPEGQDAQRKLWQESMAEMVKVDPRVAGVISF